MLCAVCVCVLCVAWQELYANGWCVAIDCLSFSIRFLFEIICFGFSVNIYCEKKNNATKHTFSSRPIWPIMILWNFVFLLALDLGQVGAD